MRLTESFQSFFCSLSIFTGLSGGYRKGSAHHLGSVPAEIQNWQEILLGPFTCSCHKEKERKHLDLLKGNQGNKNTWTLNSSSLVLFQHQDVLLGEPSGLLHLLPFGLTRDWHNVITRKRHAADHLLDFRAEQSRHRECNPISLLCWCYVLAPAKCCRKHTHKCRRYSAGPA